MAKQPAKTADRLDENDEGMSQGTTMIAEQVLIVSAPAGPRRRAGLAFSPVPVELRWEDLGEDPQATFEALRADPMLKIDGRFEERPAATET